MFKCYDCGETFDVAGSYSERVGEFWGSSAYEDFSCCPYCKGEYGEAKQCESCSEWFFEEEMERDMCDDCFEELLDQYRYDVKSCYEVLKDEEKEIKINPIFVKLLNKEQIEQILFNTLVEANVDCSPVLKSYEDWFVEEIKKGVQE